tara:strand:- start:154000 stop:154188 length:189 start_codon:yes stop_codon:yes gene_type:complete
MRLIIGNFEIELHRGEFYIYCPGLGEAYYNSQTFGWTYDTWAEIVAMEEAARAKHAALYPPE